MASLPLTGIEIPTSASTPKEFGPQIMTVGVGLEQFAIPRFADASERDALWPDAPVGVKCFLHNPGDYFSRKSEGWRPDSMPGPGDTTTVTKPAIVGSPLGYGAPENATFLSPQDIEVPGWAKLYGGSGILVASMGSVLVSAAGAWALQLGWSTDGGASYNWSRHCNVAGSSNSTPAAQWSATDGANTIDLLGVSFVRVQVRLVGRTSGAGTIERNSNTNCIYTLTCKAPQ